MLGQCQTKINSFIFQSGQSWQQQRQDFIADCRLVLYIYSLYVCLTVSEVIGVSDLVFPCSFTLSGRVGVGGGCSAASYNSRSDGSQIADQFFFFHNSLIARRSGHPLDVLRHGAATVVSLRCQVYTKQIAFLQEASKQAAR